MIDTALAAGAAVLAGAFSVATWERWLLRHRRHELAWSLAFALYAIASFALAVGLAGGWSGPVFRTFYAAGAVATVPVLAIGTVYFHFGRRVGDAVGMVVTILVAVGVGVVIASPLRAALPADELARGSEVFDAGPRIFAAIGSGLGALVVFAGAAWSAVRTRRLRHTVANLLLAAGVAANGASGLLNSVLGEMRGFVVMLGVGIVLLFAGFVVATTPAPVRSPERAALAKRATEQLAAETVR
ncbi:MAG TPA: hypothetical protein VNB24_01155 [Acidimicrobiales bacterium]|nr:hypothetical protein [Acidimicrobiales bacterium]